LTVTILIGILAYGLAADWQQASYDAFADYDSGRLPTPLQCVSSKSRATKPFDN
jgi:hypothetical protein